jgi:hypothetical protein
MSAFAMTSSASGTQAPTLFGRGGYNGSNDDDDEDDKHTLVNYGRGGYNRGDEDDDDEQEEGRGGYN